MQLQSERIFELADELNFPLANFQCSCGAGLTSKGNESNGAGYHAADNVVIEMGYNDDPNMSAYEARKKMQKQTWFRVLANESKAVKRCILMRQEGYHQVAQQRCRIQKKRNGPTRPQRGEYIHGSRWTDEAKVLIEEKLGIETFVFTDVAENLFWVFLVMLIKSFGKTKIPAATTRRARLTTAKMISQHYGTMHATPAPTVLSNTSGLSWRN